MERTPFRLRMGAQKYLFVYSNIISYLCSEFKNKYMRGLVLTPTITDRSSLSIQKYFSDIQSIKILTPEEEYEIAVKAFNGDEKAREQLVKHNLRFVISVAKQYSGYGVKLEDLINEGNIGLVKAATKFDPSRGFKFISYAVWSVRQMILAHIQETSKTIKQPLRKFLKSFKIKQEYALLEQKLERKPSYNELMESLGAEFNEDEIEFFINTFSNKMQSLDAPLNDEDGSGTLMDLITDSNSYQSNIFVNLNDSEIRTEVLLKRLNDEEKSILTLLYGLDGREPLSIKEAATMLRLSKARVSLIRDKSLRKLKYKLLKEGNWLKQI